VLFRSNEVVLPGGGCVSPRRAPRGLHVGVTGHRLNRISQHQLNQITPQVAPLLARLARASHCIEPVLLSNLAEGSDRHLAALGLHVGYTLHAVLPRPRDDYAREFANPASRRQFRALLADAARVTELDGHAGLAGRDYLRAGHAMLDQADLLLALWDGAPSRGTGGTAEVVEEACRRGIPVIHLSPNPRRGPQMIWLQPAGLRRRRCDARRIDALLSRLAGARR